MLLSDENWQKGTVLLGASGIDHAPRCLLPDYPSASFASPSGNLGRLFPCIIKLILCWFADHAVAVTRRSLQPVQNRVSTRRLRNVDDDVTRESIIPMLSTLGTQMCARTYTKKFGDSGKVRLSGHRPFITPSSCSQVIG